MAANRGSALLLAVLVGVLAAILAPALTGADEARAQAKASRAAVDPKALAKELAPLLWDEDEMTEALGEIRYFREAGFIYQPELAFSMLMDEGYPDGQRHPDDEDWKAVASGFAAVDRSYAFLFGSADDVAREQRVMESLLPKGAVKGLETPAIARLQADMNTPKGRRELARLSCETSARLLAEVAKSEKAMRFLGAHLYGILVESLYMSSVMVLAASEEGLLEPLANVRSGTGVRMRDEMELLAGHGCLGDAEKSAARAKIVRELMELVSANDFRPPLKNLREVVRIAGDERDAFLGEGRQD